MTEGKRIALMWLIVALTYAAAIWLCLSRASAAPAPKRPHTPRLKAAKVTPYPTQGAGALALLAPKAALAPPEIWGVYYFAATCKNDLGLESDYSNEVIYTNTSSTGPINSNRVTLLWDPSPSSNIVGYFIYEGGSPKTYTNFFAAGTNLTTRVTLQTELTNVVLTVTCTNGGTNIVMGFTPQGPWTKLNTTNFVTTNLPSPCYFRGLGQLGNRVVIKAKHVL